MVMVTFNYIIVIYINYMYNNLFNMIVNSNYYNYHIYLVKNSTQKNILRARDYLTNILF